LNGAYYFLESLSKNEWKFLYQNRIGFYLTNPYPNLELLTIFDIVYALPFSSKKNMLTFTCLFRSLRVMDPKILRVCLEPLMVKGKKHKRKESLLIFVLP